MDDQATLPIPGFSVPEVDTTTDMQEANQNDLKAAQPYYHAAWQTVMEKFDEKIKAYADTSNALALKDHPADEFKIMLLVAATVSAELEEIRRDVLDAVESIEATKRSGGQ